MDYMINGFIDVCWHLHTVGFIDIADFNVAVFIYLHSLKN